MNYNEKKLQLSQLEKILEIENLDEELQPTINILVSAINDWPTSIQTLEDYELKIKDIIGEPIKKINVNFFLTNCNFSKYAWEAESLSQLVQLFDCNNNHDKDLHDIIKYLKLKLKICGFL